jgi:arylsulfatase A-like enzyme
MTALAHVSPLGAPEGQSLVGALDGQPTPHAAFSMNFERSTREGRLEQGSVAMVDYPWKLQTRVGPIDATTPNSTRDHLFRLDQDPQEMHDIATSNREVVARMRSSIDAQVAQNRELRP